MTDWLEFESDPRMAAVARGYVREKMLAWGMAAALDEALLVVSELVSNAILHARTVVRVSITLLDGAVRIEVYDENSRVPATGACPLDATSGRGLGMVECLSRSWGIHRYELGKLIWAEVPAPSLSRTHPPPVAGYASIP